MKKTNHSPTSLGRKNAPYLNRLAKRGALYYALHHPSQPNYLELFSGSDQNVCNNECPAQLIDAPNLASSLESNQKTFVGFAEDLPSNLKTCRSDEYARKHCRWVDFSDIPASASADFTKFPQRASEFEQLPTIAMVIPNLVNDMHSMSAIGQKKIPTEVATGDRWLRDQIDGYAQWAMTHNSLLIITWDEDRSKYRYPASCADRINTSPPQNRVPTILVGEMVKPGATNDSTYTHYDLLRTIEEMYGLMPIGGSRGAKVISGIWQ